MQQPPGRRSVAALNIGLVKIQYLRDLGVDQYDLVDIPLEAPPENGELVALPVLGGLQHDYRLAA